MQNKVLIISLYALILNAFFRPILSPVASLFGYMAIIFSLMYPIFNSYKDGKIIMEKKPWALFVVVIISFVTSVNLLVPDDALNLFISCASIIAFYWALSQEQTVKNPIYLHEIAKANYLLCGILILYGYGPFAFKYSEVNIWGNTVFDMGLGNPNVVSVYVMFAIMILLVHLVNSARVANRVLDLIILCLLLYLIILLSSRTVIACLFLLIFGYWISRKKKNDQLFRIILLTWPFIMICVILVLGESGVALRVLGKAIETGRAEIYIESISKIKSMPIAYVFGQLCNNRFSNMHNGPLTIVANVGFVGLVICYSLWYKHLGRLYQGARTPTQRIALYAMYAFVIHASAESLSMIGTIPYAMMIIIVDKIAKGEIVDKNHYEIEKE